MKNIQNKGTKEHPYPRKISYMGNTVFLFDELPVKNKETLKFSIESTNSRYLQGFAVHVSSGYLSINGEPMEYDKESNVLFWEDSEVLDIKNIDIQIFTRKGHVFISNIWEETIYEEHKSGYFGDIDGSYTNNKIFRYPEGKKLFVIQIAEDGMLDYVTAQPCIQKTFLMENVISATMAMKTMILMISSLQ